MKGGKQPHGFTILEVTIFLAISGLLFASAMVLMNGKQDKTEFSTGIGQFVSQLQTILSNVTSGYYNIGEQNYSCSTSIINRPDIVPATIGTAPLGTNVGCVFVGDVIQFGVPGPSAANQEYIVYPMIGSQFFTSPSGDTIQATSLTQALPVALYPETGLDTGVNGTQTNVLPYGLTVNYPGASGSTTMTYTDSSVNHDMPVTTGAIGLFTTFNGYNSTAGTDSNNLESGSQSIDLVPIPGSSLEEPQTTLVPQIDSITNGTGNVINGSPRTTPTVSNPDGGVQICINSGTNNESGLINIGGSNSSTAVTLTLFSSPGCL